MTRRYTLKRRTRKQRLPSIVAINFEAGKTIQHVRHKKSCLGYANIQIAMDAPFQGRVANETVRKAKRSELQFNGYDEAKLMDEMVRIFKAIDAKFKGVKIVIQIARGRAAESMLVDVLEPVLKTAGIENKEVVFGYRRKDYWSPKNDEQFIYVNVGMFAVLSDKNNVGVGEICNPVFTRNILNYSAEKGFVLSPVVFDFNEPKNLLLGITGIKKIYLFGIADDMPFVTPKEYTNQNHIERLIKSV